MKNLHQNYEPAGKMKKHFLALLVGVGWSIAAIGQYIPFPTSMAATPHKCPPDKMWSLKGTGYAHCVRKDFTCPMAQHLVHDANGNPSCVPNTCPSNQALQPDGVSCACPAASIWNGASCVASAPPAPVLDISGISTGIKACYVTIVNPDPPFGTSYAYLVYDNAGCASYPGTYVPDYGGGPVPLTGFNCGNSMGYCIGPAGVTGQMGLDQTMSYSMTIKNTGTGTLTITSIAQAGGAAILGSTCSGANLGAGATCTFQLAQSNSHSTNGWLVISSNAGTHQINLTYSDGTVTQGGG